MPKFFALLFGTVIAIILLALYTFTMLYMIIVVLQCQPGQCTITPGIIFVHTTVAGLVSALVVAQLAVARPGEVPGASTLASELSDALKPTANYIAAGYVLVWTISGLAALVFGVMLYPDKIETLSNAGTTWLGIAVAAAYSYFGINPSGGR